MADLSPDLFAARLRRWSMGAGPDSLRGALVASARQASDLVAGTSIGQFMRDAKGERPRRSVSDAGPIRIVRGTLARAVRAPDGREGGISSIKAQASGTSVAVTLEKGVDARVAPGAYNEGRRAKSGVSLSFLRPAAEASRSRIERRASAIVSRSFAAHVAGSLGVAP